MINLRVDEAYAFDYLSILDIKKGMNKDCHSNWQMCYTYIESQLNKDQMLKIINSEEYKNMVQTNKVTFDAVEKARYGNITAKEVDEANMLRHKRKLELQVKFFDNNLMEYKT